MLVSDKRSQKWGSDVMFVHVCRSPGASLLPINHPCLTDVVRNSELCTSIVVCVVRSNTLGQEALVRV